MILNSALPVALGAVALFALGANGHMLMSFPAPYNLNTPPYVQVSPLNGLSNPYPCQGLFAVENRTTVEAGGAPTLVQFTGGAQHGGGSCQFSISYADPVTAGGWNSSARFKTIYTLIGGCPVSTSGNLPVNGHDAHGRQDSPHCGNDSGTDCIRQFLVPFPSFLRNGPATFSWTWHNHIGNREIYQNCAPITITGGTGDQAQMDALPDIFLGDLPAVQTVPGYTACSLGDSQIVNYPKPGKYGRVLEPPTDPISKPDNYCSEVPSAAALPSFIEDPRTVQGGIPFPAPMHTAPGTVTTGTGSQTEKYRSTVSTDTTSSFTAQGTSTDGDCNTSEDVPPTVTPFLPTPSSPHALTTVVTSTSTYITTLTSGTTSSTTTVVLEPSSTSTTEPTSSATSSAGDEGGYGGGGHTFTSTVTMWAHTVTEIIDDCTHPAPLPPTASTASSSTVDHYGPGADTSTTATDSTLTVITETYTQTVSTVLSTSTVIGTGSSSSATDSSSTSAVAPTAGTSTTSTTTTKADTGGGDYTTSLPIPVTPSPLPTTTLTLGPVDSAPINPTYILPCLTTGKLDGVVSTISGCYH